MFDAVGISHFCGLVRKQHIVDQIRNIFRDIYDWSFALYTFLRIHTYTDSWQKLRSNFRSTLALVEANTIFVPVFIKTFVLLLMKTCLQRLPRLLSTSTENFSHSLSYFNALQLIFIFMWVAKVSLFRISFCTVKKLYLELFIQSP